jgi:hypothetical protein
MANDAKRAARRTFVAGTVPDGKTFAEFSVPGGGTVQVMSGVVLREALRHSGESIKKNVAIIQKRHGAAGVND